MLAVWAMVMFLQITSVYFVKSFSSFRPNAEGTPPLVAIMANGTSGDINNIDFRQPRPSKPAYAQMRDVAEDVAIKVNDALNRVSWSKAAELGARYREIDVRWRQI